MSYTPHTWGRKETITAEKLNNIEGGIAEAAQSGGGYDIIIRCNNSGGWTSTASDYEIVEGSAEDIWKKIDGGEPVSALLYNPYIYWEGETTPSDMNIVSNFVHAFKDEINEYAVGLVWLVTQTDSIFASSSSTTVHQHKWSIFVNETGIYGAVYEYAGHALNLP